MTKKEKTIKKVFTNADNNQLDSLKTKLNVRGEDFFSTAKEVFAGNEYRLEGMLKRIVSSGMQTEREINDAFAYVFCTDDGVGKLLRCYVNRKDDKRFYITEEEETKLQNEIKADVPNMTKGMAHFLVHYSVAMKMLDIKAKLNALRA